MNRPVVFRRVAREELDAAGDWYERPIDDYHRWVEWSEQYQTCIGKCPDLITGIHGDDPVQVYRELAEVLEDVIDHYQKSGKALPSPKIRPMMEVI